MCTSTTIKTVKTVKTTKGCTLEYVATNPVGTTELYKLVHDAYCDVSGLNYYFTYRNGKFYDAGSSTPVYYLGDVLSE